MYRYPKSFFFPITSLPSMLVAAFRIFTMTIEWMCVYVLCICLGTINFESLQKRLNMQWLLISKNFLYNFLHQCVGSLLANPCFLPLFLIIYPLPSIRVLLCRNVRMPFAFSFYVLNAVVKKQKKSCGDMKKIWQNFIMSLSVLIWSEWDLQMTLLW